MFDYSIPLVTFDKKYEYDRVLDWIVESVAPAWAEYQARMREGFAGRWIDVYENDGKRSGAVFGAGLRDAPVHAAQLHGHAR